MIEVLRGNWILYYHKPVLFEWFLGKWVVYGHIWRRLYLVWFVVGAIFGGCGATTLAAWWYLPVFVPTFILIVAVGISKLLCILSVFKIIEECDKRKVKFDSYDQIVWEASKLGLI